MNGGQVINSFESIVQISLVIWLVVDFRVYNGVHQSALLWLPLVLLHPIPSQVYIDRDVTDVCSMYLLLEGVYVFFPCIRENILDGDRFRTNHIHGTLSQGRVPIILVEDEGLTRWVLNILKVVESILGLLHPFLLSLLLFHHLNRMMLLQ